MKTLNYNLFFKKKEEFYTFLSKFKAFLLFDSQTKEKRQKKFEELQNLITTKQDQLQKLKNTALYIMLQLKFFEIHPFLHLRENQNLAFIENVEGSGTQLIKKNQDLVETIKNYENELQNLKKITLLTLTAEEYIKTTPEGSFFLATIELTHKEKFEVMRNNLQITFFCNNYEEEVWAKKDISPLDELRFTVMSFIPPVHFSPILHLYRTIRPLFIGFLVSDLLWGSFFIGLHFLFPKPENSFSYLKIGCSSILASLLFGGDILGVHLFPPLIIKTDSYKFIPHRYILLGFLMELYIFLLFWNPLRFLSAISSTLLFSAALMNSFELRIGTGIIKRVIFVAGLILKKKTGGLFGAFDRGVFRLGLFLTVKRYMTQSITQLVRSSWVRFPLLRVLLRFVAYPLALISGVFSGAINSYRLTMTSWLSEIIKEGGFSQGKLKEYI